MIIRFYWRFLLLQLKTTQTGRSYIIIIYLLNISSIFQVYNCFVVPKLNKETWCNYIQNTKLDILSNSFLNEISFKKCWATLPNISGAADKSNNLGKFGLYLRICIYIVYLLIYWSLLQTHIFSKFKTETVLSLIDHFL